MKDECVNIFSFASAGLSAAAPPSMDVLSEVPGAGRQRGVSSGRSPATSTVRCSAELRGSRVSHTGSVVLGTPVRCQPAAAASNGGEGCFTPPWGAALPCPLGHNHNTPQCLCCCGLGDCSISGWSWRAPSQLTQPMGGMLGVNWARMERRFMVGWFNTPSVSQLHNWHGLSWLGQSWSSCAVLRGLPCRRRWGVLLLCRSCCCCQAEASSSVVVIVSVHINNLSYI